MPHYRRDHRAMRSKFWYLSNFTTASREYIYLLLLARYVPNVAKEEYMR